MAQLLGGNGGDGGGAGGSGRAAAIGSSSASASSGAHSSPSEALLRNLGSDESAEWLSQILEEMWPYAANITRCVITEYIQPAIMANMPAAFPPVRFTKVDLGTRAPRVESVRATQGRKDSQERKDDLVVVEADISFDGDPHIELTLDSRATKGLVFGIDSAKFRGRVEILVCPLLPRMPLVGATQFAFINPPKIDFSLAGVAAWADFDIFKSTFRSVADQVIASMFVLPNRISFKMDPRLDFLKYVAKPVGVLRVAVLSGAGFPHTDDNLVQRGMDTDAPDVYITLQHGAVIKQTCRVDDDPNPIYRNQVFDFVITSESKNQLLIVRAYDYDVGKQDDELGNAYVRVDDLIGHDAFEIALSDSPQDATPTVTLMARWLPLSSHLSSIQTAILMQRNEHASPLECARLMLTVNIAEARNLPECTRPYVRVLYGTAVRLETWTAYEMPGAGTLENPEFEASFHALLAEPVNANARVDFHVLDQLSGRLLGRAFALLSDVVTESGKGRTYTFALVDCARPDASLRVSIRLDAIVDTPPLWVAAEEAFQRSLEPPELPKLSSPARVNGAQSSGARSSSARSSDRRSIDAHSRDRHSSGARSNGVRS